MNTEHIQANQRTHLLVIEHIDCETVEMGIDELLSHKRLEFANALRVSKKDVCIWCKYCGREAGFYLALVGDTLQLRRMPGSASNHAADCRFFDKPGDHSDPGSANESTEADREDRLTRLLRRKRKATKVTRKAADSSAAKNARPKTGKRKRRAHQSRLAGQLDALMDVAGINVYRPGAFPVTWDVMASRIRPFVEVSLPEGFTPFNFVISPGHVPDQGAFSAATRNPGDLVQLIGSIQQIGGVQQGCRSLQLKGMDTAIQIANAKWKSAIRRTRSKLAPLAQNGLGSPESLLRLVCVVTASLTVDGSLQVDQIGLCVTTLEGIPVDSPHELRMARHLITQHRHFCKPLFRRAGELFLHDFILLDLGRPFPIEVNGMEEEVHIAHYFIVEAHLEEVYPYASGDVTLNRAWIPPLYLTWD